MRQCRVRTHMLNRDILQSTDSDQVAFLRKSPGTLPQSQKPFMRPNLTASPSRRPLLSTGKLSNKSVMLTSNV